MKKQLKFMDEQNVRQLVSTIRDELQNTPPSGEGGGTTGSGKDGLTPHIGANGNWWIGDTDTKVKAKGADGKNGLTPSIGDNGNWFLGTTDTGQPSRGPKGDPVDPSVLASYVQSGELWAEALGGLTTTYHSEAVDLNAEPLFAPGKHICASWSNTNAPTTYPGSVLVFNTLGVDEGAPNAYRLSDHYLAQIYITHMGELYSREIHTGSSAPSSIAFGVWKSMTGGQSVDTDALEKQILLKAHPVGSWYESDEPTSPAKLFGGIWEQDTSGRVLISANAAHPVKQELGEETHTLTIDEMPSHNHREGKGYYATYAGSRACMSWEEIEADGYSNKSTASTGGGQAHNIMQPSRATYRWQRVA